MGIGLSKIKTILSKHWLAVVATLLVGLIYGGPHLWFMVAAGDAYKGIPMMQTANEDFYITRIQEVVDGHPLLGSPAFFEYKSQPPLSSPTSELLYALPTILFGMPVITTLTLSKLLLPALLFLLVYLLSFKLLGEGSKVSQKISAIAVGLFVTLGYDLVDYKSVFALINGSIKPDQWLLWTRPVNPITGAIFLFVFLLFIWSIVQDTKPKKIVLLGAGFSLALLLASYFFSWGVAISVFAVIGLLYLLKRNYSVVKRLVLVFILGVLFSLPYWYITWQAKKSIWYQDSILRDGVFYTHYPLLNKLLLVSLLIYAIALGIKFYQGFKLSDFKHWHFFTLAFLLGGLWAFSEQLVTGITIWPYHFVQYTIPLAAIAVMVVLYRFFYERIKVVWYCLLGVVIGMSVWFGVYVQYVTYIKFLPDNIKIQSFSKLFDWLNDQEKDCVVLVSANVPQSYQLNGLITSFTHCNQYAHAWVFTLMPEDRIYHNYLVNLRLREIAPNGIEQYMRDNRPEMLNYLSSNWKGLFDLTAFPDFIDYKVSSRIDHLPNDYREFLGKNFKQELDQYRLDFIVSFKPLSKAITAQLPNVQLVDQLGEVYVYKY